MDTSKTPAQSIRSRRVEALARRVRFLEIASIVFAATFVAEFAFATVVHFMKP